MAQFSTKEALRDYLLKAALGQAPIPMSRENLAKAYAFFKGARQKETVLRLTSQLDVLLNLVPESRHITPPLIPNDVQEIHTYVSENALHEFSFTFNSASEVRKALLSLHDEQYTLVSKAYRDPNLVLSALQSSTKKEWLEHLHTQPRTHIMLSVTAKLSSEEFFENQMHLAFMELEPEIYSPLNKEGAQHCFGILHTYRKEIHLRKLLAQMEEKEVQNEKSLPPVPSATQRTPTKQDTSTPLEETHTPEKQLSGDTPPLEPKSVYTPNKKRKRRKRKGEPKFNTHTETGYTETLPEQQAQSIKEIVAAVSSSKDTPTQHTHIDEEKPLLKAESTAERSQQEEHVVQQKDIPDKEKQNLLSAVDDEIMAILNSGQPSPKVIASPKATETPQTFSEEEKEDLTPSSLTQKEDTSQPPLRENTHRKEPVHLPELPKRKETRDEKHPLSNKFTRRFKKKASEPFVVSEASLSQALSSALGKPVVLSKEQTDALVDSAKEMVFPKKERKSSLRHKQKEGFFLHKNNPLPIKEKLTLDTIDLSSSSHKKAK